MLNLVTGAFGFTGKAIARRLLAMGEEVRTITGHPDRENPFGKRVQAAPFSFDDPARLVETLCGAETLYNTYWIRFPYGQVAFEKAVENSRILIKAAEEAGVRRIVHISITSASESSPLPYFRGKARVERAVMQSRMSYAIIRPTVIFGPGDILINNIGWLLRKFPVFVICGSGEYRVQPVFVEDVAEIAVCAAHQPDNVLTDAVGPETYAFEALVRLIADVVGSRARLIHLNPAMALLVSRLIGFVVHDVLLTADEVKGLRSNLLVSAGKPTGRTCLSEWLKQHADTVGTRYASELRRHYR